MDRMEGLGSLSLAALAAVALLGGAVAPLSAQSGDQAERTIRAALAKWTSDFNARDTARICDLFAPDLVYDYRGFPERDYPTLCGLLHRSLADPTRTFSYALDIKEIIVSGDMAVVRLVWTLKVTSAGAKTEESREPGLDVFRRQSDGSWKIARYIAYAAP
jgi:ketosteroid isomerase-like protein